jgi:hypothetical protein
VLGTALAVGYFTFLVSKASGPAAIVIGNGLALSSTAVVLQVRPILHCKSFVHDPICTNSDYNRVTLGLFVGSWSSMNFH